MSKANKESSRHHNFRKKKHWWNYDCTVSRNRLKFWFHIWKSCSRPRSGAVFDCYKGAKRNFRAMCRMSVNNVNRVSYEVCDKLFRDRKTQRFWNLVKKSRNNNSDDFSFISLDDLSNHFKEKFDYDSSNESSFINELRQKVEEKIENLKNTVYDFNFSDFLIDKFIKNLKNGCAAGSDGITAEHLMNVHDFTLISCISKLLTISFRFGVVPLSFFDGILIPFFEKT